MQPASDAAERLQALHARLSEALDAGDWAAVAEADRAIGQCLGELAATPLADDARAARQRLKALHDRGLAACAEECERQRQRLLHHLEYAEGRAAYERIGLFGGR